MKTPDLIKNESVVRYGKDDVYCDRDELCHRISNMTPKEYTEWINELAMLTTHKEPIPRLFYYLSLRVHLIPFSFFVYNNCEDYF